MTTSYAAHGVTVLAGDCLAVLPTMPGEAVDAVVTDPPYELGFLGRTWDATGIAYRIDLWQQTLRVLKPGGHLLAFGATRTYHRLVCAIEDAGFEIRDRIRVEGYELPPELAWVHGSGMPKARKLEGEWDGWATSLRPAHEPIVVARKPLTQPVATNVEQHGTGALHIAAARSATSAARWPTNVVLLHHPLCGAECAEGCRAVEMDTQSGPLHTQNPETRKSRSKVTGATEFGTGQSVEYADPKGSGAARFFPTFRYEPKADSAERPRAGEVSHPTVKPLDLMRWLVRLVTPPGGLVVDPFAGSGTTAEACLAEGFRCITIEREAEYLPLIIDRITKRVDPIANLTAKAGRGEDVDLGLFGLLGEDGAA